MLIMVCGLPGTGKTSVSKIIARKINGIILRTDVIRKQIIKEPEYTEREKRRVYENLLRETEDSIKEGENVILDATFYKKSLRKQIYDLARKANSELIIIECVCDERKVFERMKKRKGDESEADFEVYKKIKRQWEPIEREHITIDTGKDLKEVEKELELIFNS
jgi:hypothetical protein